MVQNLELSWKQSLRLVINTGRNNDTKSSEVDDNILSKYDSSLELIEPDEIEEATDDELPDIQFEG